MTELEQWAANVKKGEYLDYIMKSWKQIFDEICERDAP
jgi:hypothetical protein